MSKNVLICEPEYDFEVISLVSSVKDYRLCWLLNKELRFDFVKIDDLEIPQMRRKKIASFSVFNYHDELERMDYFLLSNKENGSYLLPELKSVDYILKLDGPIVGEKKEELMDELKRVPYLETVFSNSINELKNKANLLF